MALGFELGDDIDYEETFNAMRDKALTVVDEMKAAFADFNPGDTLGDPKKEAEWANALNDYAIATGMSVE
jgi:hypothetical protein